MIGRLLRGVALDRLQDDVAALFLRFLLGVLGHVLDEDPAVAAALVLDALEQHFLGLLDRQVRQVQQPIALLLEHAVELLLFHLDLLIAIGQADFEVVEVLFLDRKRVELAVEDVLAFGESGIVFLELLAGRLVLALELLLQFELLLAGGELDFLGLVARLLLGVFADLVRFLSCADEGVSSGEMGEGQHAAGAQHDPEDQHQCLSHRYIPLPALSRWVQRAVRRQRAGGDVVMRMKTYGRAYTTPWPPTRAASARQGSANHPENRSPARVGRNR